MEGGGHGVDEFETEVITNPDETACLVHVVGCGAKPESLSFHSCCPGFEHGQVHVRSWKEKSQSKDDKTKASGDTGMILTPYP